MQIAQSVVVITAAGSAIGRAMAMHFSQLDAHIALIDTDASHLQTTLECCQTLKNPCRGCHRSCKTDPLTIIEN